MRKKILLLGEYSGLFKNLQEGLLELGHEAHIASFGDSWKKIESTITLGNGETDLKSKIYRKISPVINYKKLVNFDLVQYINPFYFYHDLLPNKIILNRILKSNGPMYLSAAGDDSFYWKFTRNKLDYGPFDDFLKYDLKKKSFFMESRKALDFNKWVIEKSVGVIPIMYDYELSYINHSKFLKSIPIPINLKKIAYEENKLKNNKLIIFHGLNRYGFKGTRHIKEAFDNLKRKYPNDLDVIIDGKMPLQNYLNVIRRSNIIVDQAYSYSSGMNGLYSLAMGKVVLGGAEPASLKTFNLNTNPIINIKPNAEDIEQKIKNLLDTRDNIPQLGYESRKFIEDNHDYIAIARQYLNTWKVR